MGSWGQAKQLILYNIYYIHFPYLIILHSKFPSLQARAFCTEEQEASELRGNQLADDTASPDVENMIMAGLGWGVKMENGMK